jgi:hypothetical protein
VLVDADLNHSQQLADLGVEPFDLLVSNLYPFTETVASGASVDSQPKAWAKSIGGPSGLPLNARAERSGAGTHGGVRVEVGSSRPAAMRSVVVLPRRAARQAAARSSPAPPAPPPAARHAAAATPDGLRRTGGR